MSKIDEVFDYLKKNKERGLSQVEAITMFRDFRLSGTIFDLRAEGFNIATSRKVDVTGKKYTRYHMA